MPPAPAVPWKTPRPSKLGSGCPQLASPLGTTASIDEDCLFLNVWTPAGSTTSSLPVMVFVHGGGFLTGSGGDSLYDGTKLATATGHVIVTLNYRLGPFGFLSNAPLRSEAGAHGSAGNYGILDQIAAFQWVKENIASFGGDASSVTIFGESAGGTSMFVHLASPLTKGLFSHMMIESGWAPYSAAALPQTYADGFGATFAMALGCNDAANLLSCLRAKPVTNILNASPVNSAGLTDANGVDWFPVVDGYAIPKEPISSIVAGSFHQVPTLLGNNGNEGTLFLYMSPPTDNASYTAYEESQYPGHGAAIVAEYPISAYGGSYLNASAAALADGTFLCPARKVARAIAASGMPTYRYAFDHAAASIPIPSLGAFHGSELLFVFGNPLEGLFGLQANEVPLSDAMMGYWGAMAKSGDPNDGGRFEWPKYATPKEEEIVLDLKMSTVDGLEKTQCDFWDGLGI
jgi:para-nitrobenzyl esterase